MPFIEDVLEKQKVMWGEYHPKKKYKSVVMVRDLGCVFVGTTVECQQYIRDNEHIYEKKNSRRLFATAGGN